MNKKYFIGLDIGTDSIGWAVTDEEYNLIRSKGKTMWGAHCFNSGDTAEARRLFRSARRRRERALQRRRLLREFFADEIARVDPGFFDRMDDSFFMREDKKTDQKNTLFNDKDYTDKEYYKQYKTIYHLRKALITDEKKFDIRLVYLAIEHILKHRGHFLYSGDMYTGENFNEIYREWCDDVANIFDIDLSLSDAYGLERILKTPMGVKAKQKELAEIFGKGIEKNIKMFIDLLSGATCAVEKIFGEEYKECGKICLRDESIENGRDMLLTELGEDNMHLLDKTKALYDWGLLAELLKGKKYISEAKVEIYDKHAKDLALLKEVVNELLHEKYPEVFKDEKSVKNYAAYVGIAKRSGKKQPLKRCDYETFTAYIKSLLKGFENDKRVTYILNEIDNKTFMPRQVTKDNSVIPYQINLAELKMILKNASKYYAFLKETDKYGTVAQKIESLLTFRIPYYIGPLNAYHGKYAWIEKNTNEKIRPWNFKEVVNAEASAEKFIKRMTNYCTYLADEPVLAKNSLLYCRYMVYNELNNIKVNGKKLDAAQKSSLFNALYLTKAQPKKKDIIRIIKLNTGEEDIEIDGLADDLKANMKPYIDFKKAIGNKVRNEEMIDDIVGLITVFGDEKEMLINRIKRQYGTVLTDEEIQKISKLNYSGWGRLSAKLLKGLYSDNTHENIITLLETKSENFMQIINNDVYGFNRQLEEYSGDLSKTKGIGTYSSLEELYLSPANKKRVWRVMTVVKEIVKVLGYEPEKIFIEMAKGPEEKKEIKQSRKKQLTDLYKSLKNEKELLAALGAETDSSLRRKKLYLYYSQLGRCMYSGKRLDLSELDLCDIEHIIPRSVKSDDSINNTALVLRTLNEKKSDTYPIPDELVNDEARELWKLLLAKKFISKEKYARLVRKTSLTAEEKAEFVARQLVDTRQTTKVVADIFKTMYKDSEIVYVKAGNVSKFRNGGYLKKDEKKLYPDDYLVKVREINDYHHAKDAYLNIVVGNIYNEKFNHDPLTYIASGKKYNLNRICEFDVERANWIGGHDGTIVKIKEMLSKNNILYTVMPYEQRGGFFDQMLMKKGGGQFPIKTSDPRYSDIEKYGGYNKVAGAYFALVRGEKKGKTELTFEPVPVYLGEDVKNDINALSAYFIKQGIEKAEVVIPKIKMQTLLKVDGSKVRITARSNNRIVVCNGNQLAIGVEKEKYLKRIIKHINTQKLTDTTELSEKDGITAEDNLDLYNTFIDKINSNVYRRFYGAQYEVLIAGRDRFINLRIEDQCKVLCEILKFFKCDRSLSDVSMIGGSKNAGLIAINKKCGQGTSIKIIHQSATGLFENEIDITAL